MSVNGLNDAIIKLSGLGFLFKKLNLPKSALRILFGVPEFVNAVSEKAQSSQTINDEIIYDITKSLFFSMRKDFMKDGFKESFKRENGSDAYKEWSHSYNILHKGLKTLSKALYGNPIAWEDEFNRLQ